jgi:hypothetical protein
MLDKLQPSCKSVDTIKTEGNAMQIDRRQFAFPVLALGLLSVVPAFGGADEDAIAKNLEAFRTAQVAGNTEVIASICAEELSYATQTPILTPRRLSSTALPPQITNGPRSNTRTPRSASSGRRPSCASTLSASRNLLTAKKPRKTYTS